MYTSWQGRIIHNPDYSNKTTPPPIVDEEKELQRCLALTSIPVYVKQLDFHYYRRELWLFGATEGLASIACRILNFRPFFYVDLPTSSFTKDDIPVLLYQWNNVDLEPYLTSKKKPTFYSKRKRGQEEEEEEEENEEKVDKILSIEYVEKKQASGFHYNQKKPCLLIRFRDYDTLKAYRELFHKDELHRIKMYHEHWKLAEMFHCDTKINLFDCVELKQTCTQFVTSQSQRRLNTHLECWVTVEGLTPNPGIMPTPPWPELDYDIECLANKERERRELRLLKTKQEVAQALDQQGVVLQDMVCIHDMKDVQEKATIYGLMEKKGQEASAISIFPHAEVDKDEIITIASDITIPSFSLPILRMVHQLKSVQTTQPDTLTYTFDTEADLLKHWVYITRRVFDLDLFIGYNSLAFDLPYIVKRCEKLDLKMVDQPITQLLCRYLHEKKMVSIKSKKGGSKQRGDVEIEYVHTPGFTQFDASIACRAREKLDSYSLKEAVEKCLQDKAMLKDDLPYIMIASCQEGGPAFRSLIAKYCGQDVRAEWGLRKKRGYLSLYLQIGQLTSTAMEELMLSGTVQQSWHKIQRKVHDRGWIIDEERRLFLQWLHRIDEFQRLTEYYRHKPEDLAKQRQAYLVKKKEEKVPETKSDTATKTSFLQWNAKAKNGPKLKKAQRQSFFNPDDGEKKDRKAKYTGAIVVESKVGFYNARPSFLQTKEERDKPKTQDEKNKECPLATMDFASLYPSIMMAMKVCLSTFLPCIPGTNQPDLSGNPDPSKKVEYETVSDTLKDGTVITCHWVQKYGGEPVDSIIPEIEQDLVSARSLVKKKMETEKDPIIKDGQDKQQEALKVCCNGLYGALASEYMKFSLLCMALSITAFGRRAIQAVMRFVKERFGLDTVAGDTDSIFVPIPEYHLTYAIVPNDLAATYKNYWKAVFKFAYHVADQINTCVKEVQKPMKITMEKIMDPVLLLIKKVYSGMMRNEDGTELKQLEKGLPSVRREYAGFVRQALKDALKSIFKTRDAKQAMEIFKAAVHKMATKQVGLAELQITVQAKKEYKLESLRQFILIEKMKDRGMEITPGTRVPFVMINPPKNKPNELDRNLAEDVDHVKRMKLPLNYAWYLDKQFRKPFKKILLAFSKDVEVDRIIDPAIARLHGNQMLF